MKPKAQQALACVLAGVGLAAWMALSAWFIAAALEPAERSALWAVLEPRMPLVVLAWIAGVGGIAWIVARLHARHVHAPARLLESARVLQAGGGRARPLEAPGGNATLRELAAVIDELAAARDRLRSSVDQEIAQASERLLQERNRLGALLYGLGQSVVVCNLDGRIVLYNNRARLQFRTLARSPAEAGAELIGIGRSVYTVLDRGRVADALESVRHRMARGAEHPSAQFVTPTRAGQLLRVQLSPVPAGDPGQTPGADGGRALGGFVLVLENITRHSDLAAMSGTEDGHAAQASGAAHDSSRPEFFDFDLFNNDDAGRPIEDCPLTALTYTVFDTETTGLSPSAGDQIIQVGAMRIVNSRLLSQECFDQLVDPGRPIPAAGIPIHGITSEKVAGQPRIAEVLAAFHAFAQDSVLVAHNAAFDMRFLQLQEAATGIAFRQPVLDTLLLSAVVHPSHPSHRLEDIAARFGIRVLGRHTALGDARVTAEIFLRLLPLLSAMGIHTLRQAREASQRTQYARVQY